MTLSPFHKAASNTPHIQSQIRSTFLMRSLSQHPKVGAGPPRGYV